MNHTPHEPAQADAGEAITYPHASPATATSTADADTPARVSAAEVAADHPPQQGTELGVTPGPAAATVPLAGVDDALVGGPRPPAGHRSRGRRPIIVGLAAVVVVLTVAVGLRGGGGGDGGDPPDAAAGESIGAEAGARRGDRPSNSGPVQTATDDNDSLFESGTPELEIVDEGFSSFDGGQGGIEGSWAIVVENSGDGAANALPVSAEFKDATGAVIASESYLLKQVPAGGELGFAHEFLAGDLPAPIDSMEVTLGEPSTLNSSHDDGDYTISGVTLAPAGGLLGGWRAVFTIDSSYEPTMSNADLYAVFRDADGKIVGGAFTVMATITPGTSAGEITSYAETPGVVSADIYLTGGMGG